MKKSRDGGDAFSSFVAESRGSAIKSHHSMMCLI